MGLIPTINRPQRRPQNRCTLVIRNYVKELSSKEVSELAEEVLTAKKQTIQFTPSKSNPHRYIHLYI